MCLFESICLGGALLAHTSGCRALKIFKLLNFNLEFLDVGLHGFLGIRFRKPELAMKAGKKDTLRPICRERERERLIHCVSLLPTCACV